MPSRRARQFLGRCLTALAVIQLVVVITDVVMRRLTPVGSHPKPYRPAP